MMFHIDDVGDAYHFVEIMIVNLVIAGWMRLIMENAFGLLFG